MSWGKWFKRTSGPSRAVGVEFSDGQAFALLLSAQGVENVYTPQHSDTGLDGVTRWIKEHDLQDVPIYVCLENDDYRLMLVEAPAVPDDELSEALAFSTRDLLDHPNEWDVQGCRLPKETFRGRQSMAIAVAAKRDAIQSIVNWSNSNDLQLASINIPELALLNVFALLEPEGGVGILRLGESDGEVYLYQNGSLYLTRDVEVGSADLASTPNNGQSLTLETDSRIEALILEIQRSMHYYESQMGMPPLAQLWILAPDDGNDVLSWSENLETVLGIPVRLMSLDMYFKNVRDENPEFSATASLVVALGGALAYDLGR